MARRRHWTRVGVGVAILLTGLAGTLVVVAATDPDGGSFGLPCEEVGVAALEQGDLKASTPDEAILNTEWLDQLRVPDEARVIVTDQADPDDGIVPLPAEEDEVTTETEAAGGRAYQVYVDGVSRAHIVIASSDEGSYFVAQVAYC